MTILRVGTNIITMTMMTTMIFFFFLASILIGGSSSSSSSSSFVVVVSAAFTTTCPPQIRSKSKVIFDSTRLAAAATTKPKTTTTKDTKKSFLLFHNTNSNIDSIDKMNSIDSISIDSIDNKKQDINLCNPKNDVSDINVNVSVQQWLRKCQITTAAFMTASLLYTMSLSLSLPLSSQLDSFNNIHTQNPHPPSSYSTLSNMNMNMNMNMLNIHPLSWIQIMTAPSPAYAMSTTDLESSSSSSLQPSSSSSSSQAKQQSNVIEEVWTLIDKYYIDRTFNNQEWSTIQSKYTSRLTSSNSNSISMNIKDNINNNNNEEEEAMKLTSQMVQSLGDKYSRILDKEAYTKIQKFDLIGVGATLMPDPITKRIKVGAPPVDGSEAQKGGILYGDYVTAVNGVETQGRTAFQIIDQINDDPNLDTITFTVLTENENQNESNSKRSNGSGSGSSDSSGYGEGYKRDVIMKRQQMIVKNPITYKLSERRTDGTNVGYIRISEFNSLVESKLQEAITNLKNDGANAYVLDMRSNPGGAFQSAVEIASLFMEDKVATTVVDSNKVEMAFKTSKGKVMMEESIPIVLWIDENSASAAEVFAGALHDQCRATIMGTHSFGKGLIQAVYGLKNGGGLVLTVAKYVTPNGTDIQGSGIQPNLETTLPFLYLPQFSSDTSKVDFGFMLGQQQQQQQMCAPPSSSS